MAKFTVCSRIIPVSASRPALWRSLFCLTGEQICMRVPICKHAGKSVLSAANWKGQMRWVPQSGTGSHGNHWRGSSVFSRPESQQPALPSSLLDGNWGLVWPLDNPLALPPEQQQEWPWYYQIHSTPSAVHRGGMKQLCSSLRQSNQNYHIKKMCQKLWNSTTGWICEQAHSTMKMWYFFFSLRK